MLGSEGKPQSIGIQLGISDGNFTEVLDGRLAEGQEVIVGSSDRPGQSSPSGGAPRLRL